VLLPTVSPALPRIPTRDSRSFQAGKRILSDLSHYVEERIDHFGDVVLYTSTEHDGGLVRLKVCNLVLF
jgi:hypothetical protein